MSEQPPSERELEEAAALAHALERGSDRAHLPADALEAAALIRYSAGEGELDGARQRAVWEQVAPELERIDLRRSRQSGASGVAWAGSRMAVWVRLGWIGLAAIGLLGIGVMVRDRAAEPGAAVAERSLGSREAEVLRAQAAVLKAERDSPEARQALERATRDYRASELERVQILSRSQIAELERAHAELDGASAGERARAAGGLERWFEAHRAALRRSGEVWVLEDAAARLCQAALADQAWDRAQRWIRAGLELGNEPSPHRVNLLLLGADLAEEQGDEQGALASYVAALGVYEALFERSLGQDRERSPLTGTE